MGLVITIFKSMELLLQFYRTNLFLIYIFSIVEITLVFLTWKVMIGSKLLSNSGFTTLQKSPGVAPGLAYFHIPLPEFWSFFSSNVTKGARQEGTFSASTNSGFLTTLVARGDVKSVFVGHDHVNDFCGKLKDLNLCYGGGFGYHAYGKAGCERRARVVVVDLNKKRKGNWGDVKSIGTWKRLDDKHLSVIDSQVLWTNAANWSVARRL